MGHVEETKEERRKEGRKDWGKERYLAVSPLKQDSWQETSERRRKAANERARGIMAPEISPMPLPKDLSCVCMSASLLHCSTPTDGSAKPRRKEGRKECVPRALKTRVIVVGLSARRREECRPSR